MTYYCLFNTKNNRDPLEAWNSPKAMEEFGRIGEIAEVIEKLKRLFPRLVNWEIHENENHNSVTHSCLGSNNCNEEVYLDISVTESCEDKGAYLITVDRATNAVLKEIMRELNIKHVFFPEAWELIDVEK